MLLLKKLLLVSVGLMTSAVPIVRPMEHDATHRETTKKRKKNRKSSRKTGRDNKRMKLDVSHTEGKQNTDGFKVNASPASSLSLSENERLQCKALLDHSIIDNDLLYFEKKPLDFFLTTLKNTCHTFKDNSLYAYIQSNLSAQNLRETFRDLIKGIKPREENYMNPLRGKQLAHNENLAEAIKIAYMLNAPVVLNSFARHAVQTSVLIKPIIAALDEPLKTSFLKRMQRQAFYLERTDLDFFNMCDDPTLADLVEDGILILPEDLCAKYGFSSSYFDQISVAEKLSVEELFSRKDLWKLFLSLEKIPEGSIRERVITFFTENSVKIVQDVLEDTLKKIDSCTFRFVKDSFDIFFYNIVKMAPDLKNTLVTNLIKWLRATVIHNERLTKEFFVAHEEGIVKIAIRFLFAEEQCGGCIDNCDVLSIKQSVEKSLATYKNPFINLGGYFKKPENDYTDAYQIFEKKSNLKPLSFDHLPEIILVIKGLYPLINDEKICLSDNGLTSDDLNKILHHVPDIKKLYLRKNKLDSLPSSLKCLKQLTALDCSDNNITSIDGIINLKQLRKLNLSKNAFNFIPYALDKIPSLEVLDLSKNNISTLSNLINLQKLTSLNVSGDLIETVTLELVYLKKLRILDLSKNQLSTIPKEVILALPSLEVLRLHKNRIPKEEQTSLFEYLIQNTKIRPAL